MADSWDKAILEVCVDSIASARAAYEGKADRIELCANLLEGGVTPSYGLVKMAREAFPKPGKLMVLIRPRGGDFVYSEDEMRVMTEDIVACADLGADGVVIGCLIPAGEIDVMATSKLMTQATGKGLDVTFHRAFDMVKDQTAALQQLKALGIRRVLTSGGQPSALVGAGTLAKLVGEAGRNISIMAGGGVNEDNVSDLVARTGVREVHSTAARSVFSSMQFRRPGMSLCALKQPMDYAWGCSQLDIVTALREAATKAVGALPK